MHYQQVGRYNNRTNNNSYHGSSNHCACCLINKNRDNNRYNNNNNQNNNSNNNSNINHNDNNHDNDNNNYNNNIHYSNHSRLRCEDVTNNIYDRRSVRENSGGDPNGRSIQSVSPVRQTRRGSRDDRSFSRSSNEYPHGNEEYRDRREGSSGDGNYYGPYRHNRSRSNSRSRENSDYHRFHNNNHQYYFPRNRNDGNFYGEGRSINNRNNSFPLSVFGIENVGIRESNSSNDFLSGNTANNRPTYEDAIINSFTRNHLKIVLANSLFGNSNNNSS